MRKHCHVVSLFFIAALSGVRCVHGENRSFDGRGNNVSVTARGSAMTPMIRFGYSADFSDGLGAMFAEPTRPNARTVSNTLMSQAGGKLSARGLSDYIWAWGQFVTHDLDLTTDSNGTIANGSAPIAVTAPGDPLGPNPIPFVRMNFVATGGRGGNQRIPVNEVSSYLDGSQIYGSDAARAAALRTDGGLGAKLLTSAGGLLPFNAAGLAVENNGPLPDAQLFVAGDIRASENVMLSSIHSLFAREHNRLVDRIAAQQPTLSAEDQYQLARKLVGAEIQAITYREFLPALLGSGATTPKAEAYKYSSSTDATITTAFAQAAFRFGHSAVSPQFQLVQDDGTRIGSIAVRDAFYNPQLLAGSPATLDMLLKGAASQVSQEIDLGVIDDLRNFLFGPPGAGGVDLAALNIQRGRDAGVPDFRQLALNRKWSFNGFAGITSDPQLAAQLAAAYNNDINNIDAWVGMLAEDHAAGASVGAALQSEIASQFQRLRDGDRLFYRGLAAGLYSATGVLDPTIAALVNLDTLRLSDVIRANTSLTHLQANVFFAVPEPCTAAILGVFLITAAGRGRILQSRRLS